ncbi:hypothetical protein SLE2022_316470 [Rubroshorea leprosula]
MKLVTGSKFIDAPACGDDGEAIEEGDTDHDAHRVDFKIASNGGRQQEGTEGLLWSQEVSLLQLIWEAKRETRQARKVSSKRKYRRIFPWVASNLQATESGNRFMERHQTDSTFEH